MKDSIYNQLNTKIIKDWYCEVCKKDINSNTKSSHIKSAAHIENEVISEAKKESHR